MQVRSHIIELSYKQDEICVKNGGIFQTTETVPQKE